MIFFAIRHIKTGELMPEIRTRCGYSYWNPDNPNMPKEIFWDVPRLFSSKKRAKKCISEWFACQNGRRTFYQNSFTGEYDDDLKTVEDNRKKEDLEVVEVTLDVYSVKGRE